MKDKKKVMKLVTKYRDLEEQTMELAEKMSEIKSKLDDLMAVDDQVVVASMKDRVWRKWERTIRELPSNKKVLKLVGKSIYIKCSKPMISKLEKEMGSQWIEKHCEEKTSTVIGWQMKKK